MKDFTDDELDFIEEQLNYQDNLELVSEKTKNGGDNIKIAELSPPSKKDSNYIPAYKKPMHWVIGLIIAPIILSAVLMFLIARVEAMFGTDSLDWLANDSTGQSVTKIAESIGFTWLPTVIEIYKERWLIVGLIFTVFFILAAIVIIYDNFIAKKLKKRIMIKKQEKRNRKLQEQSQKTQNQNNENDEKNKKGEE